MSNQEDVEIPWWKTWYGIIFIIVMVLLLLTIIFYITPKKLKKRGEKNNIFDKIQSKNWSNIEKK